MSGKRAGGGGGGRDSKRSKKNHFVNAAKGGCGEVDFGSRGVLITMDTFHQPQSKREGNILMSEYCEAVPLTPSAEEPTSSSADAPESSEPAPAAASSAPEDLASALQAELSELKEESKSVKQRFRLYDSIKGSIFIRCNEKSDHPADFVHHVMQETAAKQSTNFKFLFRMIPVLQTCPAKLDLIKTHMEKIITAFFAKRDPLRPTKYAIVFKSRFNSELDRMEVINSVAELVPRIHLVDLKTPDVAIFVHIAKNAAYLGIADRYQELKEFNLHAWDPKIPETKKKEKQEVDADEVEAEGAVAEMESKDGAASSSAAVPQEDEDEDDGAPSIF